MLLPQRETIASGGLRLARQDCQARLTSVSPDPLRLGVVPLQLGEANRIVFDGSLVKSTWGISSRDAPRRPAGAKVGGRKPCKDPNHDNVSDYGILALLLRLRSFRWLFVSLFFEIDGAGNALRLARSLTNVRPRRFGDSE